jgi:hypothetical protein
MRNRIISLTIFSIAMGFLEAVVVVYLRQLYYPEGFAFPLKPMVREGFFIESLREISSIIMLISVGVVAGRMFSERLAYILYCFGIWDVFYYVWLKVLLDWPKSLLTWDILFLIPMVWAGPVLAPITCAFTMVAIGVCILYLHDKGRQTEISSLEWTVLSLGGLVIFSSFIWEYAKIMIRGSFMSQFLWLGRDLQFQKAIAQHIPDSYNWYLFALGECMILCFLMMFYRRASSNSKPPSEESGPLY